jgi:hypothetical protein
MRWVLLYESADDVASRASAYMEAHGARLREFAGRGDLLQVGTFADPQRDGSMAIFASREAVLEFVSGDPFVQAGVVRGWRMLEWNEILG